MVRQGARSNTQLPAAPAPAEDGRRVYSPPQIAHLGSVRDLTLGREHQDTADLDKARYN